MPARRQPHLGQVRREGRVPQHAPPLPGDALQPLRQPALRAHLPGDGHVPAHRRHRGVRLGRCIGCKACLQACPYDAIYIDPDTDTAAKCHYCAHRTDVGSSRPASSSARRTRSSPATWTTRPARFSRLAGPRAGERAQARAGHRAQALLHRGGTSGDPPDGSGAGLRAPLGAAAGQGNGGSGPGDWRGPIQIAPGRMAGAPLPRRGPGGGRFPKVERPARPTTPPTRPLALAGARLSRHQSYRHGRVSRGCGRSLAWASALAGPLFASDRFLPGAPALSAPPWDCWCSTWSGRIGSGPSDPAAVEFVADTRGRLPDRLLGRGGFSWVLQLSGSGPSGGASDGPGVRSPCSRRSTPRFCSPRPRGATSGRPAAPPGTSCRPSWPGPRRFRHGPLAWSSPRRSSSGSLLDPRSEPAGQPLADGRRRVRHAPRQLRRGHGPRA